MNSIRTLVLASAVALTATAALADGDDGRANFRIRQGLDPNQSEASAPVLRQGRASAVGAPVAEHYVSQGNEPIQFRLATQGSDRN